MNCPYKNSDSVDVSEQWFAVRTRSNREATVTTALAGKGLDVWFPRYSAPRPRSEASGKAAFPGYVFCRLDVTRRMPVLTTPGVVGFVSSGRNPLAIDQSEITSLRLVMESLLPVRPHPFLNAGDAVKISEGPLTGAEGYVVRSNVDRLVVCITLLQRSVCVAVESHWLKRTNRIAA
ncbi:MAG: transcriptional activator RfaH [Bryobacterales bacterium]|nr:transcriptional activator RfaH [Bryobacterales bacterium]